MNLESYKMLKKKVAKCLKKLNMCFIKEMI